MKFKCLLSLFLIFISSLTFAQSNLWKEVKNFETRSSRYINPEKYILYQFDWDAFIKQSKSAIYNRQPLFLSIPQPDGSFSNFDLIETSIFEEELTRKYPGFTSFTGYSKDIPGSVLKMSVSPFGINVMILKPDNQLSVFIDPIDIQNKNQVYQVYFRKDYQKAEGHFSCGVAMSNPKLSDQIEEIYQERPVEHNSIADCQLRSYRLALACTGEYATFHGGTKERVLAAYNTTMTRVNGLYERDLGVTMKLIANTDLIIYLNASSDPYSNNDGESMLDQNQRNLDIVIGSQNYDIGHVFSTGGGGIAFLNAPCNANNKAKGVTGQSRPVGDPFDIDYVAHEMGHQFGANHTQNNNCNRNGSTAIEPGSASTIMGYAGICSPNVQNNSDGYFHGISVREIHNYIVRGFGNTCATYIDIPNSKPTLLVDRIEYTIPISTSFALTANATDEDDDFLTYSWEQIDNRTATMPPRANSTNGPMFRSLFPTTNPTRYFPDLERKYGTWEVLPSVERTMNFKCTVRDNHLLNGCVEDTNVAVKTSSSAGPFVVLNPNTSSVTWTVGTQQPVIWDVAKTDLDPVNCKMVNIYLSIDGGFSYPYLVADSLPNTGMANILVPSYPTSKARIMVKATDNIFFDVSNVNFKIVSDFSINVNVSELIICDEDVATVEFSLDQLNQINAPIHLKILPPYDVIAHNFSDNDITNLPAKVILTLSGLNNLIVDEYPIFIEASSGVGILHSSFTLIKGLSSNEIALKLPANFAHSINPQNTLFTWNLLKGVKDYLVEISNSTSFDQITFSKVVTNNQTTFDLSESTSYFWRVKPNGYCVDLPYSAIHSFRTLGGNQGQPTIIANETLLVDQGESTSLTDRELNVYGQNNDFIQFTILSLPAEGSLSISDSLFNIGDSFSMTDILDGSINYQHYGGFTTTDTFTLSIIDDEGRWHPNVVIPVKIKTSDLGLAVYRVKPLKCNNDNDAVVSVKGYGGLPPYTYSIDGITFVEDSTFIDLEAGSYHFYIKDANELIYQSEPILIKNPEAITIDVDNIFYDISVIATGGSGTLSYSINNSDYSDQFTFTDPGNGLHVIKVKDIFNCQIETNYTLNITPLTVESIILSDAKCYGDNISILAKGNGGFLPYQYSINDQQFSSDTILTVKTVNNVVRISDAGGKIVISDTIYTNNPSSIEATFDIKKFVVTIQAQGGTGPLEYSRNGYEFSTNNIIEFNDNGAYKIYVRDSLLCNKSYNIQINTLKNVNVTKRDITCNGKEDGYIRLVNQGGTPPIQYQLEGSDFTTTREWQNLKAGIYNYVVRDSKGDNIIGSVEIVEPDLLEMNLTINKDTLEILITGGTPPFKYSIDNGSLFLDTNIYTELEPSEYNIVVKDKSGCLVSGIALIVASKDYHIAPFVIYPNPAYDEIHIQGEDLIKHIQIFNLNGLKLPIKSKSISGQKATIDISDLPSGIFLIELEHKNRTVQGKFVKLKN